MLLASCCQPSGLVSIQLPRGQLAPKLSTEDEKKTVVQTTKKQKARTKKNNVEHINYKELDSNHTIKGRLKTEEERRKTPSKKELEGRN
mmetsp:Transcript_10621/g.14230  ORF Transcript_10621/g.14230 Transcript_10621/m.14230 type:complete len:89 (+) Transcript_10621:1495-1761(+)